MVAASAGMRGGVLLPAGQSSASINNSQACRVSGNEVVRIALVFHGLLRGFHATKQSMEQNIRQPLERVAPQAVDTFLHTWRLSHRHEADLHACKLLVEDQDAIDAAGQHRVRAQMDLHNVQTTRGASTSNATLYDEKASINMRRELYSRMRACELVGQHEVAAGFRYTHIVNARPDACYFSPLVWAPLARGIVIPNRLRFGGVNDQFAYGDAASMRTYMLGQNRERKGWKVGESETMLCAHLTRHAVPVALTPLCFARVRDESGELAYVPDLPRGALREQISDWPAGGGTDLDFAVNPSPNVTCAALGQLAFVPRMTDTVDACAATALRQKQLSQRKRRAAHRPTCSKLQEGQKGGGGSGSGSGRRIHELDTEARISGGQFANAYVSSYEILKTFEHDSEHGFTQGLTMDEDGYMYESDGLYGKSAVRSVDIRSGETQQQTSNAPSTFGEGATIIGNRLLQLTWKEKLIYEYSLPSLDKVASHPLSCSPHCSEGWGLAYDGTASKLYLTDSTDKLFTLDPTTLETLGAPMQIYDHTLGRPINGVNELEMVNGELWGNVYPLYQGFTSECIVRINATDASVLGWIDMHGLLARQRQTVQQHSHDYVLNGIAYHAPTRRLYVTGKQWDKMYQVRTMPAKAELQTAGYVADACYGGM